MRGQTPLTEAQRSDMFLSNVQGVHREHAQHLLTSLRVSLTSHGDGPLPPHLKLHLNDLAERLMDHLRDGSRDTNPMSISTHRTTTSTHRTAASPSSPLVPHIQGYCVNVARAGVSVARAPHGVLLLMVTVMPAASGVIKQ